MQFMVLGYDGTDAEAPQRRQAVRPRHLELSAQLKEQGRQLYGAALLDDAGAMIGSLMVYDFPSRAALDAALETEPYITGNVWQRIEIQPCRVAPAFLNG